MNNYLLAALISAHVARFAVAQDAQDEAPNGLLGPDASLLTLTAIESSPETATHSVEAPGQDDKWDRLTGDWFGTRKSLADRGVFVEGSLTIDYFKNTRGGIDTEGSSLASLFSLELTMQTDPLFGFKGGTFFAGFDYQKGQSPGDEIGDFQGVSSIDADGRTQLGTIWYEQALLDSKLRIRAGKMDANADFACPEYGGWFMNGAMACPVNVPLPTYPDNAFGLAVFGNLTETWYLQGGVYDGAAQEGYTLGDEGPKTLFGSPTDLFLIAETGVNYDCHDRIGGRVGVGVWRHTGTFDRFDGGSESGTNGIYLTIDHRFYRENADEEDEQGLSGFTLYSYADPSVSEASHHLAGGLVYRGLIETRDDDAIGLGATWSKFSDNAGFADDGEIAIEGFYEIMLTDFASIRPDVQYIVNPGGAGADDAIAVGLRVSVAF